MTVEELSAGGGPDLQKLHRACEQTLALLRSHGVRLTSSRRAVVRALHAAAGHPTVEQLSGAIPGVDLSSIYRCLEVLTRVGAVQQVQPGQGAATFHLLHGAPPHAHAHCSGCGAMIDVSANLLAGVTAALERETGFVLAAQESTLRGRCYSCCSMVSSEVRR